MINPKESDIKRRVIYNKGQGNQEEGVITSFNDSGVFVRYGSELHSKHTRREDLTWSM